MRLFVGYLIWDLFLVLHQFATFPDLSVVVHHVLILIAYSGGLVSGWGTLYLAGLLVNEISTPFINQRYILKHQALTGSAAYGVNGICLALSFFVFRILACLLAVGHISFAWLELAV